MKPFLATLKNLRGWKFVLKKGGSLPLFFLSCFLVANLIAGVSLFLLCEENGGILCSHLSLKKGSLERKETTPLSLLLFGV